MKRRNFIGTGMLAGAGLFAGKTVKADVAKKKKRVLRVAQVTDMHISPRTVPEKGIRNLVEELNNLNDKPDFVLNTGDNIMDSLKENKDAVAAQWEAWDTHFNSKLQYKTYNCIGNHDVWGWGLKNAAPVEDPLFGKAWAMQKLNLPSSYYSFTQAGWKFICLDSVSPGEDDDSSYTAKLDKDQFKWLKDELKATSPEMPVCIVSHIPILSSSVFFDGKNEQTGDWQVPGAWMHIDARSIKDLFQKHPNVKLALSGHVHLVDRVNYLDVHYLCNGAACGAWWGGSYQEFAPAYALLDFYNDGSYHCELINYNWK